jgi:hypothetical protein
MAIIACEGVEDVGVGGFRGSVQGSMWRRDSCADVKEARIELSCWFLSEVHS